MNRAVLLGGLLAILAAPAGGAGLASLPEKSAAEGLALRDELLAQQPAEDLEATATLKIRDPDGKRSEVTIRWAIHIVDDTAWQATYEVTAPAALAGTTLQLRHQAGAPTQYRRLAPGNPDAAKATPVALEPDQLWAGFAGSDYSAFDLGLEFLRWPGQRLVKREMRRGRPCRVLESANPRPADGAYARVLSWIDNETGGLLRAEAYDARGRLLKEFSVRSFKKVDGRWQLKEMEIRNEQTDSRTTLTFDLDPD
jgi:hypothetical protein